VSSDEQADEGVSLDAQAERLRAVAESRGWDFELVTDAGISGKNLARPALQDALDRLDKGEADVLVSVHLDRLSRNVHDFTGLMMRADRKGWRLICLDPEVDTKTPMGKAMQQFMAVFAEFERGMISVRTKSALQELKRQGVQLGKPTTLPDEILQRIADERGQGRTLQAICDGLAVDGVRTGRGGLRWYPSSIKSVLASARAHQMQAA
jgi:DNA invertase Pin-like site-specific DNA recombinase